MQIICMCVCGTSDTGFLIKKKNRSEKEQFPLSVPPIEMTQSTVFSLNILVCLPRMQIIPSSSLIDLFIPISILQNHLSVNSAQLQLKPNSVSLFLYFHVLYIYF